jgi:transglutaminase-like putative cysteine protease
MRKYLYIVALAAACNSSKGTDGKPAQPAAAADPWSQKQTKPTDVKDPDLAHLIEVAQSGPGTNKFPQADAYVDLERDDITLAADGTVTQHHKSIAKLLDPQRGKEKFADVHVPFDQKRQTLEINMARTVNDDGVPHAASKEEIGDIVPSYLSDATIYSDVRERVVSFPAVDKGSVVELEYTRVTKATPDSALGGEEMLGQWDPVHERTVTITVPKGVQPKLALAGVTLEPTKSTIGDGDVYTYTLKDLPDRHPESESPPEAAVLPRLVYSFQPSWQKVIEPVANRFLAVAVPAKPAEAVKAEADRIVGDAKTESEKLTKLYAFVSHDIHTVDVPLGYAGYEPHAPELVLQNKYADQRDKVGLLLAMAAAEGIAGRPVLVRTGTVPVIASVPTIAQFDRMVAKVTADGKDVWLDPDDEHGQFGVVAYGQANLVLPIEKGGAELGQRPALDPSTSVAKQTIKYVLSANGDLQMEHAVELTGTYATQLQEQLRPLKGENLDRWFQQQAAGTSAAAVDKGHQLSDTSSVAGAFTMTQKVAIPGYSQAQGTFRVLELPSMAIGMDVPSTGLSERKYPLFVGSPRTEQGEVSVQIPSGWKVAYVPPKLEGSAEGAKYSAECTAEGQTVTCKGEVTLDKIVVPTDKYGALHDAMAKLQAYERRIVLLVKA